MKIFLNRIAPFCVALAIAGCNAGAISNVPAPGGSTNAAPLSFGRSLPERGVPACTGSRKGMAQCDVMVSDALHPDLPSGWGAEDLQSAYKLPSTAKGSGQIVAIVDAYDNPNVASDLAEYRSTYGLGTANFTKYNQTGQTSNYPAGNSGWGLEIDLDVEMVSAACPNCTIYLVEANSSSFADIQTAEAEAVTLGAHIVSNSYDGNGANQSYYDTPGVLYAASGGDSGYGLHDPADFDSVVAVGGTELSKARGKRGWAEIVWPGAGAGCSTQTKPSWQHDPGCTGRTGDDVSAVALDVAEYDTYGAYNGWVLVQGTSISSPLVAAVFGLAGNATSQHGGKTFWGKRHERRTDLNRVSSGNDGTCSPTYLCTAGTKEYRDYSGPAGWGTPNGIGAF